MPAMRNSRRSGIPHMRAPQNWRGLQGSVSGALATIAALLLVVLTTSGCIHMLFSAAITNANQAHKINELEKRIERAEEVKK